VQRKKKKKKKNREELLPLESIEKELGSFEIASESESEQLNVLLLGVKEVKQLKEVGSIIMNFY
jgi:hypothetical protein